MIMRTSKYRKSCGLPPGSLLNTALSIASMPTRHSLNALCIATEAEIQHQESAQERAQERTQESTQERASKRALMRAQERAQESDYNYKQEQEQEQNQEQVMETSSNE